jgi:ribosomal protein S18 acetylase RimI-like enzyme
VGVVWVLKDDRVADADYVQFVAVVPERRRHGVARRLLGEAIRLSGTRRRLLLRAGVHKDNAPSLRLFAGAGFVLEPAAEGDLLLLRRPLAPAR